MKSKAPKKADERTQSQKFEDTAREVETNNSEEAFNSALRKIAKASPEKKSPGEK